MSKSIVFVSVRMDSEIETMRQRVREMEMFKKEKLLYLETHKGKIFDWLKTNGFKQEVIEFDNMYSTGFQATGPDREYGPNASLLISVELFAYKDYSNVNLYENKLQKSWRTLVSSFCDIRINGFVRYNPKDRRVKFQIRVN